MSLITLVSAYGASSDDGDIIGAPEASIETLAGSLTTSYSVIYDPTVQPRPAGGGPKMLQRTIDVQTDFAVDMVSVPDGQAPAAVPNVKLRPPSGGAVGYRWVMASWDGVIYAKLP